MLGLPGFVLLAVSERDGELERAVETTAIMAAGWCRSGTCPPTGGRCRSRWLRRLWRCAEPDCPAQTWTETSEAIRARASLTERARRVACERDGRDDDTVAQVAAEYSVG